MHVERSRVEDLAVRLVKWTLLLAILTSFAIAQDSSSATQPSMPKQAPAATPETLPKSVAGMRPESYVIGAEDTIQVYVWKEPDMSKSVPVRPDGMISLPLVGEVKAAGYTPVQLQDVLADAIKKYVSDPQVTVVVEKVASLNFNVVGEVNHPGYFPLTRRMTVLDAIALAGGFKDFAKTKKIYVLRTAASGTQERLPFNYKQVIKGQNPQQNIELQPRDTIVVP